MPLLQLQDSVLSASPNSPSVRLPLPRPRLLRETTNQHITRPGGTANTTSHGTRPRALGPTPMASAPARGAAPVSRQVRPQGPRPGPGGKSPVGARAPGSAAAARRLTLGHPAAAAPQRSAQGGLQRACCPAAPAGLLSSCHLYRARVSLKRPRCLPGPVVLRACASCELGKSRDGARLSRRGAFWLPLGMLGSVVLLGAGPQRTCAVTVALCLGQTRSGGARCTIISTLVRCTNNKSAHIVQYVWRQLTDAANSSHSQGVLTYFWVCFSTFLPCWPRNKEMPQL